MEQTEKKHQFPSEEVTLPSKGLLYPEGSPLRSGVIEMKYMTAREEDILTNQNYIKNGTVIDKLLQSLILSPINYNDLLIGDKVGEGVFGISFKIKGPPEDLSTTVNPIKTLTPRFITRTLEKLKKN